MPRRKEAKARKAAKEQTKGSESERFGGNCDWCGTYGHEQKDCWAKAAGKPKVPKSPRGPDLKSKGKGKGYKGKNGASSLDEWPEGHNDQWSGEEPND